MSLNSGFWSLWHTPYSDGYLLGDLVSADLERNIAIRADMRRRDPRVFNRSPYSAAYSRVQQRAARHVYERQLVELGIVDLGEP